jgi:hypothetical protein
MRIEKFGFIGRACDEKRALNVELVTRADYVLGPQIHGPVAQLRKN